MGDDGLGRLPSGEGVFRTPPNRRPGVASGERPRRTSAKRGQVCLQRLAAGGGQAAVSPPKLLQRCDQVTSRAPGHELGAGMRLAQPDRDAIAELDPLRAAAGAVDADRAHRALGWHSPSFVERCRGHTQSMLGGVSRVGDGVWRYRFDSQMTLPRTANWPRARGTCARCVYGERREDDRLTTLQAWSCGCSVEKLQTKSSVFGWMRTSSSESRTCPTEWYGRHVLIYRRCPLGLRDTDRLRL